MRTLLLIGCFVLVAGQGWAQYPEDMYQPAPLIQPIPPVGGGYISPYGQGWNNTPGINSPQQFQQQQQQQLRLWERLNRQRALEDRRQLELYNNSERLRRGVGGLQ